MRTNSECVRNILTGGKNQVLGVTIEISDDLTASLDEMEPHEAVGMAAESADRWNSLHIHRSLLISVTSEEPNIPRPGFLPSYMENLSGFWVFEDSFRLPCPCVCFGITL